jgi:hypothetical protein
MRIGKFELVEPLPELRNPHVIASLTPWIDAGSVGSLTIERIERFMDAEDLGKLATPGTYFHAVSANRFLRRRRAPDEDP